MKRLILTLSVVVMTTLAFGQNGTLNIEKTPNFKIENRTVKKDGKIVKYDGKILRTPVKLFYCLYDINNFSIRGLEEGINSKNKKDDTIQLKYTIFKNVGSILNSSADSLIFIAFKMPNGVIEKSNNKKCLQGKFNKEYTYCFKFDKLPYTDSLKFPIKGSRLELGNYYINFFTQNCNFCEFKLKL